MATLTPADYADTGQWRLLIKIKPDGMSAHLENTLHEGVEPLLMFESKWDAEDDAFLKKVENAVYEHPRVLDDFATKIILFDRKTLFMPTQVAEEEEGNEEKIYTSLYPGENEDIMIDTDRDITAVYNLGKGLKSFLLRTFPGARISSNLMDALKNVRKINQGLSIYIFKRDGESDYIFLDGSNLISASTHFTDTDVDTLYHAFNILDAYGYSAPDVKIEWKGIKPGEEVSNILKLNKNNSASQE